MNVLVCGRMKEGKTTFAIYLAYEWSDGVFIWDPRHMITYPNATYVTSAEELEDAIEDKVWQRGPIIFRPDGLNLEGQFEEVCDVLFDPPERFRNWSFLVDEASGLQSANRINDHLSKCVRQHPRSVLVIQTTHSLQDWSRTSKDLMSCLYCFRLQGRSLVSVIDYCDGSHELEETIRNLPRHHLVRINFEASRDESEFIIVDDPGMWYSPATKSDNEEEESYDRTEV